MRNRIALVVVVGALLVGVRQAHAIRIRLWPAGVPPFGGTYRESSELWAGYRSILLLPVRNETTGGPTLARQAEEALKTQLRSSRKFSIEELHARNPVVIRAKTENMMRDEDLVRWQQTRQLEDAFNLGATIGVQSVGELRIAGYEVLDLGKQGSALKLSVVGILHDAKTRQKEREVAATAETPIPKKNSNPNAIERQAISVATRKVVSEWSGRHEPEPGPPRKPRPAAPPRVEPAKAKPPEAPPPAPKPSEFDGS